MQYYINKDIIIKTIDNPAINSSLMIDKPVYFTVMPSYPDGVIQFHVYFWKELNGEKLEYDWHRTFTKVYKDVVPSQDAALDIFFNMVPELAEYTVNNSRRFIGVTLKDYQKKAEDLINEVDAEAARFNGFTDLADMFDSTNTVTHKLWNWLLNEDEIQYLRDKFDLVDWELIKHLEQEYGTKMFEVPPLNLPAVLYVTQLKTVS